MPLGRKPARPTAFRFHGVPAALGRRRERMDPFRRQESQSLHDPACPRTTSRRLRKSTVTLFAPRGRGLSSGYGRTHRNGLRLDQRWLNVAKSDAENCRRNHSCRVGVFLLATGVQIPTVNGAGHLVAALNWAGQRCWAGSVCVHPEWIAAGVVLELFALLLLRSRSKDQQP